jgi:phosphopantothenoylcysteine decarboxylase / phosphopantothenate---cysteine ligase
MHDKEQAHDVVLALSGSVAAYKGVELLRQFVKRGLRVQPLLTRGAARFVGPETLSALSGYPCLSELFSERAGETHVQLAQGGARFVIAPATADVLARIAQGRADDLVTATALCWPG